MSAHGRETVEAEIGRILLEQWDPLGMRAGPNHGGDAPYGPYAPYAHEVYVLLARGASDVQIARRLHQAERDELQHPELADRDLTSLVRALRAVESHM